MSPMPHVVGSPASSCVRGLLLDDLLANISQHGAQISHMLSVSAWPPPHLAPSLLPVVEDGARCGAAARVRLYILTLSVHAWTRLCKCWYAKQGLPLFLYSSRRCSSSASFFSWALVCVFFRVCRLVRESMLEGLYESQHYRWKSCLYV